ncbi:two-component system sensor histidine kinase/response regulator [Aureimonas endophytica]|uniref:histidine kinase n=1 Tax=Aureimonas endophytica TaxID=2027858 RepID=A0A917EA67_9HYPH|nr:response regulator [Aureimonas endophytica]GGE18615.1 two-component system sensor histidine kinase/response regulator [Aureimonas endophytica]
MTVGGPPRFLYIDDDEGLRRLSAKHLQRRGFDVVTAATGPEGIALLEGAAFDVVAIDHYMPEVDGLETLRRLAAALPDHPPVVYVTGSDESRIAVAALKAGAADYVVKSIGEEFFDLLATALLQAVEREGLKRAAAEAQAALRDTNARLETLLREMNHRIANSLQMVSAFVIMQTSALGDENAKAALRQTQQRILAVAQAHRKLYTADDIETVEMADYLAALLVDLEDTWSAPAAPRRLRLEADVLKLKTDKAVAVGVIVNELVSNACKYAYPADGAGEVRVLLRRKGETGFHLAVEDDGPGFEAATMPRGTGIGRKLVAAMAANLRCEVDYRREATGFRIRLDAAI